MRFKNTADNYGSIAKWLHWGTAILFLASYSSVYYRHWFTEEKTLENWIALQLAFINWDNYCSYCSTSNCLAYE